MIRAGAPLDVLARRLEAKAKRLAEASALRRRDPRFWRRAGLLWPLFAKG